MFKNLYLKTLLKEETNQLITPEIVMPKYLIKSKAIIIRIINSMNPFLSFFISIFYHKLSTKGKLILIGLII